MRILRKLTYRLYRATSSTRHWIRRRFTQPGHSLIGLAFVAGCMSFETEQKVTYQAFCLAAAILGFSVLTNLRFRLKFSATRLLPEFASVGTPVQYRVEIRNLSQRSHKGLLAMEGVEDPRPELEEFIQWQIREERLRKPFRMSASGGWPWVPKCKIVGDRLVSLPPCASAEVAIELIPLARGFLRFKEFSLGRTDLFGLFKAISTHHVEQSLVVLPRRYQVPRLALPGNQRFQQGGVALAGSVGESEEFVSLRDYRPGDPLRRLHWKSWARTGKPIVKEYQEEFFVRHALILDTFQEEKDSHRQNAEVFEEAVSVAASYACTLETQESLLDLLFVGTSAYCFTSGRGLARTEQMLEILAGVSLCSTQPFSSLESLVLQHLPAVSGCILILLQWDENRKRLLQSIRAVGLPVVPFLVVPKAGPADGTGEELLREGVRLLHLGSIAQDLNRK